MCGATITEELGIELRILDGLGISVDARVEYLAVEAKSTIVVLVLQTGISLFFQLLHVTATRTVPHLRQLHSFYSFFAVRKVKGVSSNHMLFSLY